MACVCVAWNHQAVPKSWLGELLTRERKVYIFPAPVLTSPLASRERGRLIQTSLQMRLHSDKRH